jgi:hypothetical protein
VTTWRGRPHTNCSASVQHGAPPPLSCGGADEILLLLMYGDVLHEAGSATASGFGVCHRVRHAVGYSFSNSGITSLTNRRSERWASLSCMLPKNR